MKAVKEPGNANSPPLLWHGLLTVPLSGAGALGGASRIAECAKCATASQKQCGV